MDPNKSSSSSDDDWGDDHAGFFASAEHEPSDLDAFGDPAPVEEEAGSGFDAFGGYAPTSDTEEVDEGPIFSATNPPGTITVHAYMNGSLQRIDLSPAVVGMTEAQLAQEISELAALATMKAGAGQYVYLLYVTVQQIGDSPDVREMLRSTLGLPTPEEAAEAEAAYVSRYARDEF
jgi:hypothetical protein